MVAHNPIDTGRRSPGQPSQETEIGLEAKSDQDNDYLTRIAHLDYPQKFFRQLIGGEKNL